MEKSTAYDVAHLAGVSQSTVSLVMRNSPNVSFKQDTVTRVLNAAEILGYTRPAHKEKRVGSLAKAIAILVPTMTDPYYREVVSQIERQAYQLGYGSVICNTLGAVERERDFLESLDEDSVIGFLYTFDSNLSESTRRFTRKTPIAFVGSVRRKNGQYSDGDNNIKAGFLLADHLFLLGHKNLVYITASDTVDSTTAMQRLSGMRMAVKQYPASTGIRIQTVESGLRAWNERSNLRDYAAGQNIVRKFIKGPHDITAAITDNEMIAFGMMQGIQEKGMKIPRDISLCSIENSFLSNLCTPNLTTVDFCLPERCRAAIELLVSNDRSESDRFEKMELEPKLIARGSTGIPWDQTLK